MFRSEDVKLFTVKTNSESAWELLNLIGTKACTMIEQDHVDALAKGVVIRLKALDDWKIRLDNMQFQALKFKSGQHRPVDQIDPDRIELHLQRVAQNSKEQLSRLLDRYISEAEPKMKNLNEFDINFQTIMKSCFESMSYKMVLENIGALLPSGFGTRANFVPLSELATNRSPQKTAGSPTKTSSRISVGYFAGLVDTLSISKFQKLAYRITRGRMLFQNRSVGSALKIENLLPKNTAINSEEYANDESSLDKSVIFLVIYGDSLHTAGKILNLARSFEVQDVVIPDTDVAINNKLSELTQFLKTKVKVLEETVKQIQKVNEFFFNSTAEVLDGFNRFEEMTYLLQKEKVIQTAMGGFTHKGNLVSFDFWVAESDEQNLLNSVRSFQSTHPDFIEPIISVVKLRPTHKPPTRFALNDFLRPYQDIVNTYAIPRYKEANPAVYSVATFPFFFGLMFGDVCHGGILLAFGIYLVISHEHWKKEGSAMVNVSYLRYLVLLMGFFSVYSGFLYNEFASVNIPLFDSCYELEQHEGGKPEYHREPGCIYPFGVDFVWGTAENDVSYLNSLKMKVAIIVGVIQMLLGISLKGANAIFFNSGIDFWCEFVPQMIFMLCSFGYMVVLIIVKWLTDFDSPEHKQSLGNHPPPQIISIFTSLHSVTPELTLLGNSDTQQLIQTMILSSL